MKQNEAYPSKFLSSADLIINGQVKKIAVTFAEIARESITGENWGRLAELLGSDDSDDWIGQSVVLSVEKVRYQGKMVNGLAVIGKPKPGSVPAPPPPPPPQLHDEIEPDDDASFHADDDDVPF